MIEALRNRAEYLFDVRTSNTHVYAKSVLYVGEASGEAGVVVTVPGLWLVDSEIELRNLSMHYIDGLPYLGLTLEVFDRLVQVFIDVSDPDVVDRLRAAANSSRLWLSFSDFEPGKDLDVFPFDLRRGRGSMSERLLLALEEY